MRNFSNSECGMRNAERNARVRLCDPYGTIFLIFITDKRATGFAMIRLDGYRFHLAVRAGNGLWREGYDHVGCCSAERTKFY